MIFIVVFFPFLLAALLPLLSRLFGRVHAGWLALPAPALLLIYFASLLPEVSGGKAVEASLPWMPSLDIRFDLAVDGLGMLFALLIGGIGVLVTLYSVFYLDRNKEALTRFYVCLLLFMGAMLGVVLSDHLIALYAFWELTSVSSFLLIAFWHHRQQSRDGAMKSMLITVLGGLSMLAGFLLLYLQTGTFSIRETIALAPGLPGHSLFVPAMLLILLGAFTKSAQFPFHIWLPDAMEAPTPVSAYLHSATMVKAGLYLAARMTPVFAGQAVWYTMLIGAGLLTLFYGSFRAFKQTDLKALLAYSTISQLGLIMALIGLGSVHSGSEGGLESMLSAAALAAAILHLVNHAAFKGTLFMAVGIVDHETGTRDIRKLGGLMALMPVTFTISLLGALSMAGVPPFGGYISKELFLASALDAWRHGLPLRTPVVLVPLVAWLGSVFTFAYSLRFILRTFGGRESGRLERRPHEAPAGLLLPPALLGAAALLLGLAPGLTASPLVAPALASIHPAAAEAEMHFTLWHGLTTEVWMTAGVFALGTGIFFLQRRAALLRDPLPAPVTLNGLYGGVLGGMDRAGRRLTSLYMTGSLRHYTMYLFGFLILALAATAAATGGIAISLRGLAPVTVYEAVILTALIAAAAAVPFARSRLMAIILTGAVGYMVVLFFVVFRAPDLALTQIIVETVSVTLFLLCFYHLPALKRDRESLRFRLPNFIIALGVGAVMTLIALAAFSGRSFESISDYYLKESYRLAGGKNVVNVILVDFRGFDTMLEIVVLGVAAFAIYALIRLRLPQDEPREGADAREKEFRLVYEDVRSNDVILRTLAKVIIFIILTFSLYLLFAGHHEPGGGFIGALMTSSALVLLSMAFGIKTVREAMPVDFRLLAAAGIGVAVLTGVGSIVLGVPFLSHTFGYVDLPVFGKNELATAVIFDLGVYMTVVGITMTIILAIGRDK
ncbi:MULTISPECIES: Na+/H+ antiporter subunit A [unclassified Paenibacillus]|uniref:Na+/H+ antiporter subunit A n=1 Tax=unclassified Paenibacillus TaxID=185978 RepID=UPI0009546705|nr:MULTISPECIES: Na+/H+ antiporter subunit A [unclassified Paenibacillus]SIQ30004.1 multicomponent Na+:H+ antiporter subunit A [Paenibacillus sp. RU4X]SIQ51936.1 multicomponent Na+:H+ antiporter subunit A [Paenibacillus sp. RU4T]